MRRWFALLFLSMLAIAGQVSAQTTQLSAAIQIIGEDLAFQRVNTMDEKLLPVNALAPFGIGDRIRTGANGRAFIMLSDDDKILLLPNSEYEIIDFQVDSDGKKTFHARLSGIAVHNLQSSKSQLTYQLTAETFVVTEAEKAFTVWSVTNGLQAVTSADGYVTMVADDETPHSIEPITGMALPYSTVPITLEPPLHASQVIANVVTCQGSVVTHGSAGLRLRAGAALDFIVVDVLQDGQQVPIAGATENGLWYRIPFQSGFGWLYSTQIESDCVPSERFPDLVGEEPERIRTVTEAEIELLEPFYGTPVTNSTFYR